MNKRNHSQIKRRFRKFLVRLFLILTAALFLLLLIGHLLDLSGNIDILARHITEQNARIDKLEMANTRLHNVAAYQYEMIQELQYTTSSVSQIVPEPSVNIVYEGQEVHTETNKINIKEVTDPTVTTTLIVTIVGAVGKVVSTLLPSMP